MIPLEFPKPLLLANKHHQTAKENENISQQLRQWMYGVLAVLVGMGQVRGIIGKLETIEGCRALLRINGFWEMSCHHCLFEC